MNNIYKILRYIFVFGILLLMIKYVFLLFLIWGFIESIIWAIKKRNLTVTSNIICNFVLTVLNCIDILSNIVFSIPANRILITTTEKNPFGNPKHSFTKVLRLNFVYGTLKPRGIVLYNIINFFKKTLK